MLRRPKAVLGMALASQAQVGNQGGEGLRGLKVALSKVWNWLPGLTQFLAGFLVPVVFKMFSSDAAATPDSAWFPTLLIIFVALSVTTLLYLRADISREVERSYLNVKFHYKVDDNAGDDEIYDPIIRRIREARKSVRILGSFRQPGAKPSPARDRYFKAIEEILLKKSDARTKFVYERFVQVADTPRNPDPSRSVGQLTTLHSSQVDSMTYDHCEHVMQLMKRPGRVQYFLKQIGPVMPMVTIILVDDNYLVICLPWIEREKGKELETEQLGKGLFFHDREGAFCAEMDAMLNVISYHSWPILDLIDDQVKLNIQGSDEQGGAANPRLQRTAGAAR